MKLISKITIALVALIHLYILWFEMFAWTSRGPKVFSSFPLDLFEKTTILAANQGLYNGFIAAGLIWTFFISDITWKKNISFFFLSCVITAGIYGAITAETKIFFVQALPAIIALIVVGLSYKKS